MEIFGKTVAMAFMAMMWAALMSPVAILVLLAVDARRERKWREELRRAQKEVRFHD
jgi:hypothetical protein